MDTQTVAGVESVIYTTPDAGMANTFINTSRTGLEAEEFDGGYEVHCTTPEQIASFFALFGADLRVCIAANAVKDLVQGRTLYDMSQSGAGVAEIDYCYPVSYTPDVATALTGSEGEDIINWWVLNTPTARQIFADAWLASDGAIDPEMKDMSNPDGTPVYTTPDLWYGTVKINGEEYFNAARLADQIDLGLPSAGGVEMCVVDCEGHATSCLLYPVLAPEYSLILMATSDTWKDVNYAANLASAILDAIGR